MGGRYVNVDKSFILELEKAGFLPESIADILCADTEFVNLDGRRVSILRFKGISTRKFRVRTDVHTNPARQKIIRFKNEVFDHKINIRILILDTRDRDVNHLRHYRRKNHINYPR
jgi:hypothetical protein